jgi:hypothetical protein
MAGICATVGALGFSMIGLPGVANAAALPHAVPSVVQHAQLAGWGGPGWRGPGPGFPGWGFPPPPPCPLGLCI